jgi:sarcosine oxidase, subunit delta
MLLIPCPWCGPRPEIEFRHAGAAHVARPAGDGVTDRQWGDFLTARDNPKGRAFERWRHVHGCGQFFNAERDTVTDQIATTYKPGESHPGSNNIEAPGGRSSETS